MTQSYEEETMKENHESAEDSARSRRAFIKTAALLGGTAVFASRMRLFDSLFRFAQAHPDTQSFQYPFLNPENMIYTSCLQCNTGCGIKVKIFDGIAAKIDGNPLNPWTMTPHLPYSTPISTAAVVDGALCPKGQSGIQTAYDPYRIVKVLKRAGKRGENKWAIISFEQAIDEIVDGGYLFKSVPGEENRFVDGIKQVWALRDPKLAKQMAEDVGNVQKKQITVDDFKAKYKDNLNVLIDPEHPDLGPKNNEMVFAWGRLKAGREQFIRRFTTENFGSVNAHGHTTVCQGSLYFTCKALSEQYQEGKWTGGRKFYWQADTGNSEFIIFVGASPFEANYGPPLRGIKITEGLVDRGLKIVVVDPRLSKTAAKAWKWLPAAPGSEGALALAMINWIIEHERFDKNYLENANKAAATQTGEPTWTNASWLVKIGADGAPGPFLRSKEAGMDQEDRFVAMKDGEPVNFDPYDTSTAVKGELFVDATLNGIHVKSGLQVLSEEAKSRSLEQWAEICGVSANDIEEVAKEFTSHGKKAAADIHRGVSQHTNGFYNVFAWMSLNLLVGNFDWKGGMVKATAYDATGGGQGQPFPLSKMNPAKTSAFGISLIRHDQKFEETTIFKGYPAKRPWYPLSSDIYQEIMPSASDAYPYPIKILFLYMGTPNYSLPAGQTNIAIVSDVNKIPLFVTSDIIVGETSMYSDYIFPDLSYLERWEFQGSHPSVTQKVQPIRQPAIAPIPETVIVYGREQPISLEAMILGIAEKLGLPGFGKNAFGEGQDFLHQDDLYLKMTANVAAGDKPGDEVPEADDSEASVFLAARRHLPKSVFDADRWKAIVGEGFWRKVVYLLNRGGRFQDYEQAYSGEQVTNKYGTLINIYQEKTAKTISSTTGKHLRGYANYISAPRDILDREINDPGYDLRLITYREISHTKSRTISNYWLLSLLPENFILMNKRDADAKGISDGDLLKLSSASNPEGVWDLKNGTVRPMITKAKVVQGMRPGVVAVSLGHGHWAYGSKDVTIDGIVVSGDARRAKGAHPNAAMRIDPYLENTCLSDPVGGSAVFYDTYVRVAKI